jgi:hypothetical protein
MVYEFIHVYDPYYLIYTDLSIYIYIYILLSTFAQSSCHYLVLFLLQHLFSLSELQEIIAMKKVQKKFSTFAHQLFHVLLCYGPILLFDILRDPLRNTINEAGLSMRPLKQFLFFIFSN